MADEWAQIMSFCFGHCSQRPRTSKTSITSTTRVTPDETVEYTQVDAFVLFELICDLFHINKFISF